MNIPIEKLGAWAEWLSPEEMDERDFVAGDVVWLPSDKELDEVPSIDLSKVPMETIDQWCVPSCTAVGVCHSVLIQNVLDHKTVDLSVSAIDQWEANQKRIRECKGRWDYLETAVHSLYKNGVKGKVLGKDFRFKIDGHMYESWKVFPFDKMLKLMAYRIGKLKQPLYLAFRGNYQISKEITEGRWKTVITLDESTYGHATLWTAVIFEEKDIVITNSRDHNTLNVEWKKKLSTFRISFDVFEKLLANGIFGWRYFLTFDKKDMATEKLFVDYATGTEPEHTEAVTWVKENGIVKWVPSPQWARLEPHTNITRLQVIIMIYRAVMWLLKKLGK
jgi:hypothetical protein